MATLKIRVVPNAKQTSFEGVMDDGETLKLRLAAPPVDGKANDVLVRWLAEMLAIRRSEVRLVAGEKSRAKVVSIEGLERTTILSRIQSDPAR